MSTKSTEPRGVDRVCDVRMAGHQPLTVEEVEARLRRFDLRQDGRLSALFPSNQYPHIRRCATLVPLFFTPHDRELHVLLTQRAATLRTHASSVAFPGGVQDPGDADDIHTALREAHEEIGLQPSDVTVVALLPPTFVRPLSAVYHVVGFIPDHFQPAPNHQEVARVFSVPLRLFVEAEVAFLPVSVAGLEFRTPVLTYPVQSDWEARIWGMTCGTCMAVARAVYGGRAGPRSVTSSDHLGPDDEEDVFRNMQTAYHALCQATRPPSRL